MAYEKRTWVSGTTPLSAENMNHMEEGIAAANEGVDKLNTEKIKVVAVQDSCITDTNNSGMQAYPYRGTIWGNTIIAKVDDLIRQGHAILGGTLVAGPFQDAEVSQGYGSGHGLILQTGRYNNVPARFTINSTGYQTMTVIVAIFYI